MTLGTVPNVIPTSFHLAQSPPHELRRAFCCLAAAPGCPAPNRASCMRFAYIGSAPHHDSHARNGICCTSHPGLRRIGLRACVLARAECMQRCDSHARSGICRTPPRRVHGIALRAWISACAGVRNAAMLMHKTVFAALEAAVVRAFLPGRGVPPPGQRLVYMRKRLVGPKGILPFGPSGKEYCWSQVSRMVAGH